MFFLCIYLAYFVFYTVNKAYIYIKTVDEDVVHIVRAYHCMHVFSRTFTHFHLVYYTSYLTLGGYLLEV